MAKSYLRISEQPGRNRSGINFDCNKSICVIGQGYIGLPTAAILASRGYQVLGVDVRQEVVDKINCGESHIHEPNLDELIRKVVASGNLRASMTPERADIFILCVPTPFHVDHSPDLSFVQAAAESIQPLVQDGATIILESTSPPGTTEDVVLKAAIPNHLVAGENVYVAYCPERVLPGNVIHELVHNDRVIGGVNKASTQKAIMFYDRYVKGELHATNAKTAEMCKLVENSSRDVQIAFANELSLICDKAGINVWELIKLANKHPRVNILQPGCGVGGHCIAVDPYFIVSDYPMESKIIGTAREVNNYKSFWCAEKIQTEKLKFELKHGRKPKVALMGLAFKPNIDDLRESPAKYIAQKVLQNSNNEEHFIVEPNIESHSIYKLTDYKKAINQADIIVFLVAHKEFINLQIDESKLILDFCGISN